MKTRFVHFLLVLFLSLSAVFSTRAQSLDEIRIDEYYWHAPLTKVLEDFKIKYQITIEYDSALVAGQTFNYLFNETPARKALDIIFRVDEENKIGKSLSHFVDEHGVVHVVKQSSEAITRHQTENLRHTGAATTNDITVTGVVKEKLTGESLPFATVSVRGSSNGTVTNIDGQFTLFKVPSDTSALLISYVGYKPTTYFLNPDVAKVDLVIELESSGIELNTVEIVGETEKLMETGQMVGVITMSPKKITTLPSLGEKDIFRAFQLMPGVSGSNEASSGLFVRGGTPDQNLILYDGYTIYHVDHLFGMFSAFNANAIKDTKLHKGGFESKYGGRISSVMEIVGKDGNENNFNVGGDASLLSVNAFAEIPIGDRTTVLVAGRRSWRSPLYNSIFDSFNDTEEETTPQPPTGVGRPGGVSQEETQPSSYFYDLNAKVSYRAGKKDIISYSFFNGQDDLDNSRISNRTFGSTTSNGGTTDLTKWGNWATGLNWSRKWSKTYYSNTMLSYSNYFSERDRTTTRSLTVGETVTEFSRGQTEDNDLRDYTFKTDHEWQLGKPLTLEFGGQMTHYNIDYDFLQNDTVVIQQRSDQGNLMTTYLQSRVKLFDHKLTLVSGLRSNWYTVTEQNYLEPRASAYLNLHPKVKLKGAWGHYYQFANRIIRNDISSGSRDFWVLADDVEVPISFAEHFIAGVSVDLKDYLFDVEVYHKNLSGLSEYSLQFVPSFGNVDYNEFFYEGTGTARGAEFLLQKKYGKYSGWVSYTLGEVLYDFPIWGENPFPANHDVTHEFKFTQSLEWRRWTFAGTFIYATGKPYTEPLGGYTVELIDGSTESFISLGERNQARYPAYHRLDLAATYKFLVGKEGEGSLNFSIFNLYGRKNIWYKEFEVEENNLIETDVTLLGFTPNVTLSLKLR